MNFDFKKNWPLIFPFLIVFVLFFAQIYSYYEDNKPHFKALFQEKEAIDKRFSECEKESTLDKEVLCFNNAMKETAKTDRPRAIKKCVDDYPTKHINDKLFNPTGSKDNATYTQMQTWVCEDILEEK